jgi:hypothetical protein
MREINIELNKKSQSIIRKQLNVKKIEDVISRDYIDFSPENNIDREKTKIYSRKVRGSVRLKNGRFYTTNEYQKRVDRVKALELP